MPPLAVGPALLAWTKKVRFPEALLPEAKPDSRLLDLAAEQQEYYFTLDTAKVQGLIMTQASYRLTLQQQCTRVCVDYGTRHIPVLDHIQI